MKATWGGQRKVLACVAKGHVFPLLTEFMEDSDQRRLQTRPPANTNCHKSLEAFSSLFSCVHVNAQVTRRRKCAAEPRITVTNGKRKSTSEFDFQNGPRGGFVLHNAFPLPAKEWLAFQCLKNSLSQIGRCFIDVVWSLLCGWFQIMVCRT